MAVYNGYEYNIIHQPGSNIANVKITRNGKITKFDITINGSGDRYGDIVDVVKKMLDDKGMNEKSFSHNGIKLKKSLYSD